MRPRFSFVKFCVSSPSPTPHRVDLKITHLSGTTLKITNPLGTVIRPGNVMVIKDWGMPQKGSHRVHGNLNIKFRVNFPKQPSITPKVKEAIEKGES